MKIKIDLEMYEITGAEDKTLKTILSVIQGVLANKGNKLEAIKAGLKVVNANAETVPVELEM